MSEATANLGRQVTVSVYVEDRKAAVFKNLKAWNWSKTYYSGEDEYLGDASPKPWQVPKGAEGGGSIEEDDAAATNALMQALADAELTGQRPKVVLVERTTSSSGGPLAKVTFPDATITLDSSSPSKGERKVRALKFRSAVPKEE